MVKQVKTETVQRRIAKDDDAKLAYVLRRTGLRSHQLLGMYIRAAYDILSASGRGVASEDELVDLLRKTPIRNSKNTQ